MKTDGEQRFVVSNPAPVARAGVLVARWEGGRSAGGVTVFDEDLVLPAQLDSIDFADPSRDEVAFRLTRPIPPNGERVVRIVPSAPVESSPVGVKVLPMGVRLESGGLAIWLQLHPVLPHGSWFGGAATSVELDHHEMLDASVAKFGWLAHDPEKRAMQLDRIRLFADGGPSTEVSLFDKPWRVAGMSAGPVRGGVTIVSPPFRYRTADNQERECRIYRRLSLWADAEVVHDRLWLQPADGSTPPPEFAAGYFMMADLGIYPEILRHPPAVSDWFVVAANVEPNQGYGFATNARVGAVSNPPAGHPNPQNEHRAFSWELGASSYVQSLHLFRLGVTSGRLGDEAGKQWYDVIFKPLRATLLRE